MNPLIVTNLEKNYPGFRLDNVSFTLAEGKITGFIGRNGAGKTTTLKSMLDFVHPDGGRVAFFGMDYYKNSAKIKQRIGFVSGGVDYYEKKPLRTLTNVTKTFYENWDESAYRSYMDKFRLDEKKTPSALSAGMRIKYALTLALSHRAELLILDEPTSGLDPVSRDELMEHFLELTDKGTTILFSTHITSDLDKCADNILYIQNGRIAAEESVKDFINAYRTVNLAADATEETKADARLVGVKRAKEGFTALVSAADAPAFPQSHEADLETIMVHLEKEADK